MSEIIKKKRGRKPKNIIKFEDLESIYGSIHREEFNILIKEFEKLFQKYILYHFIHPNAVKDFLISLRTLRTSMML